MPIPFAVRPAIVCVAGALCVLGAQAHPPSRVRAFDIPAGDLKAAVDQYARETGSQVLYKLQDVQGLTTAGVRGSFDEAEALRLLLVGTPLSFKKEGASALVLFRDAASKAASETSAGADTVNTLEAVTVTAQRRPEEAQSVPIALTSFSAATLERQRLSNLADVSRLTPGLLVSAFSASNPTIAIRGANNTFSQMGVSKPVAVAVDDVFVPRNSAAAFELFDLENVTVLKGPQGTLFGRNVTGGAVVMQTRKPQYDVNSAEGQLTLGNFGAVSIDALANLALGDEKALKLSIATRDRNGAGRDRLTERDQDDLKSRNARGQLRFGLADVEGIISADYGEDSNNGRTLSSNTLGDDGNRRTSEVGVAQSFDRTLWGASAKFEYSRPWGDITSVTAYRHADSAEVYSSVGASYKLLVSGSQLITSDSERVSTISEELRYATPTASWGSFQTGVFLLDEDGTRQLGTRSLAAVTGATVGSTLSDQSVRTRSYSLFADGTWRWTSSLSLSAGGRYTHDQKTASLVRTNLLVPAQSFSAQGLSASWHEFTPRLALNWQPSMSMLFYTSITKGFTAGGFNTDATSLAALTTPFNPETVVNREVGMKSQWLDNRLRVNVSLFDMDYRDKQEFVNNTTTGILSIVNASSASIRGAEVELAYKPASWLNLSATYGQLKTRYDKFQIGNINNTGNPMASSPRDKASVAADWRLPVAFGVVTGALSYGWQSAYNTGAANDPNLRIPSYGLLNFNVGLEAPDRRWRVQAWVKNATNRDYILTRSTQVVRAEYLGAPRTYGVTLGTRY